MTRQMNSAGGSGRRPPFLFLRLVHLLTASLLLSLPLAVASATTAPTPGSAAGSYRLAGVMLVGQDRIGFLEVPAGGQVLVRVGSFVDGGKVTVFDEREVRIVFPDRTVVLELEGGAGKPRGNATLGVVVAEEDQGHVMVRQVDPARMGTALEATKTAATVGSTPGRKDAPAETARRFSAVVNLPPNARVLAVNEKPVVSADAAIREVEKALAGGYPGTLTLASGPGQPPGRVYLLPKQD